MLIVLHSCTPPSSSSSSVWTLKTLFAPGIQPACSMWGGRSLRSVLCPRSPPPLGLSQPLSPVRLFYSPGLMRAFNFSFTTSVTPTFNNTPCARQKFAPGNHGFDHKNHSGEEFLVNSFSAPGSLEPALLKIRWNRGQRPKVPDWEVSCPPPTFRPLSPRLWGRRRFQTAGGHPDCRPSEVVEGNPRGPRSLPSLFHLIGLLCADPLIL